jgi:hypothetical protein
VVKGEIAYFGVAGVVGSFGAAHFHHWLYLFIDRFGMGRPFYVTANSMILLIMLELRTIRNGRRGGCR